MLGKAVVEIVGLTTCDVKRLSTLEVELITRASVSGSAFQISYGIYLSPQGCIPNFLCGDREGRVQCWTTARLLLSTAR